MNRTTHHRLVTTVLLYVLALFGTCPGMVLAETQAETQGDNSRAASGFSLEQVRDYAFPDQLVAAKQGEHVVWVKSYRGRNNIWTASAPEFKPRQLTHYTQDDGQEISGLALSDDGRQLIYVRGGESGGNWDETLPINPASSPVATKVEVHGLNLARGKSRLLAEGHGAALSPDGRQVAFIKDDAAWIVPSDGSKQARQLFTTRGTVDELTWSPDSRRMAFVTSRESHAFVGIYQDDATPIVWLAPDAARDQSPVWSPDGRKLAFIRTAGDGGPPKPRLQLQPKPWSIWVADATTGRGSQRWASGEALRDSQLWGNELQWGAQDELLFRSYQDDWQHLYSLPAGGGAAKLLTPGDFMVEHYTLSPDRRYLVYNANTGTQPDDIDRRHLYRVAVDGSQPPQTLTSGTGIETYPALTASGQVLFFSATAQRPPQLAMLADNAIRLLDPQALPPDYPQASQVTPRRVTFKAEDGVTVHAQLFEPPGAGAQRRLPAVVYIHGGPERQMLLGWHYMGYYSNDYAVNQYLASQGYVVLSVNYRLGFGYGHAFNFPANASMLGASEYRDIRAAGRYLQSLPTVDAQRVGVYGGSYGGYLTAMALAHDSALFKVGVDVHGVHDWVTDEYDGRYIRTRYEEPPDAEQSQDVAWRSSPVSAINTWKSPVLFIHGDDDRNVKFSQTVDLVQRLRGTGVQHQTLVLVDETHNIQLHRNALRMNAAVVEFLRRHLEPGAETRREPNTQGR